MNTLIEVITSQELFQITKVKIYFLSIFHQDIPDLIKTNLVTNSIQFAVHVNKQPIDPKIGSISK